MAQVLGDPIKNELEQAVNALTLILTTNQAPSVIEQIVEVREHIQQATKLLADHRNAVATKPKRSRKSRLW